MSSILSLFSKSPFGPIQDHMQKAKECVELLRPLFAAVIAGDQDTVEELASQISDVEHDADKIKNAIRERLGRQIFLPVAREDVISLLAQQDMIPDAVEDLAFMATMRRMVFPPKLREPFQELLDAVMAVFDRAYEVVQNTGSLQEAGFGGREAERQLELIQEAGHLEWLADKAQFKLAKSLFKIEDELDPVSVIMWSQLFQLLGRLGNHSEKTCNMVRMMLSK